MFYITLTQRLQTPLLFLQRIFGEEQILSEFKNKISLFAEYIVKDGETPEQIAFERYDDPFLNWTILIANDIVNYHDQWALDLPL